MVCRFQSATKKKKKKKIIAEEAKKNGEYSFSITQFAGKTWRHLCCCCCQKLLFKNSMNKMYKLSPSSVSQNDTKRRRKGDSDLERERRRGKIITRKGRRRTASLIIINGRTGWLVSDEKREKNFVPWFQKTQRMEPPKGHSQIF